MKREGRQHGMVMTHHLLPPPYNPRPNARVINQLHSPATAGLFTKVSPKPTGHSKFTGKCEKPRCNMCHVRPTSKSKDKAKGSHKLRSYDMLTNCRLMSWRVVDGRPGLNFSGFSATQMLDHLGRAYADDRDYDDDEEEVDDHASDNNVYDHDGQYGVDDHATSETIAHIEDYVYSNNDDDEEDKMSFCDVGFMIDQVEGEEDWFLVGEM